MNINPIDELLHIFHLELCQSKMPLSVPSLLLSSFMFSPIWTNTSPAHEDRKGGAGKKTKKKKEGETGAAR